MMDNALLRAITILSDNRKVLNDIANKLVEVETLEQEEYEKILTSHHIALKKKEEVSIV